MDVAAAPRRRRVVLLGATGSIGRQALDVIARYPDQFTVVGAVAGRDTTALVEVAVRHGLAPEAAVVVAPSTPDPRVSSGVEAACAVAARSDADVVLVGITGSAALLPTLAAVDAGHDIAIATKEVLVMAGELVRQRAARSGARLLPVDSEHSALWQCLRGEATASVARLVLTASGGPFRETPLADLAAVGIADALRHPTWVMGPKVTIDSATMMNKGLEIIEAHHLFGIPVDRIDVAIHPASVVHSMVEFVDGATMAQVGLPDMRIPIALGMTGGDRLPGICPPADLTTLPPLEFLPVDPARFPAPGLARAAAAAGNGAPCVLNAANEAAVAAFLEGRCAYLDIVALVADALDAVPRPDAPDIDALLALDAAARAHVARSLTSAAAAG